MIKLEDNIKELKMLFEKIGKSKKELQIKIQKIFTKIRNILNQREDELLLEVDNLYYDYFFKDDLMDKSENLPKKVKLALEKGKSIENEWNDENKLNSIINDCINIENEIKSINSINEGIEKLKINEKKKLIFIPENSGLEQFILNIKQFGEISEFLDSLILTKKEDKNKFNKLISSRIKLDNMKLLYRYTKDGKEIQNVKNKIDRKSNLIFLFFTGKKEFLALI